MINVTIWNEFRHEKENPEVQEMYPEGIHHQLANFLPNEEYEVKTATLDEEEHGLIQAILNETDVLL